MQARSGHGTGSLLGIFHCHNPGSSRRSAQPSQPPSPGLRSKALPTPASLHHGATCLSHPSWATPTVFQPFHHCLSTKAVPGTPVPAQLLLSLPLAVLCTGDPRERGQGCAAQQLCPAPRRRHPSATGTFTPLLTRGWPFQPGPEPRQPGCQLKSGLGGRREAGGE